MVPKICSFNGCPKPHLANGYCSGHYQQMWRGEGLRKLRNARTDAERFWPRVEKSEGCWLWTGAKCLKGYGHFSVSGKQRKAHRWAYENLIGPIPEGLVLDHLCRTPSCVNPDHLEPVTNDENLERGWGRRIKTGLINECVNGHAYTPENTYINPMGRLVCRTCSAISRQRYEQRVSA